MLTLVIIIVVFALIFDFINGFHDAANAISTIVASKTLTPLQAVFLAGISNFIGYFTFGTAVAKMVGKGVVNIDFITLHIILATIVGAIIWNLITWFFGIPTSSSHALIGALIGAGIASAGIQVIIVSGLMKIFLFIFIAPLLGMLGSIVFTIIIIRLAKKLKPQKATKIFKRLQPIATTFYSIGHGTNDAQKTMGIIALTLYTSGINKSFIINDWVVLACYSAISMGTLFGGWRIVKTMGTNIIKIRQMEGFCADTAAAFVLLGTAHAGIPVSTTHVIAGSIMGVGTVEHVNNVRWITARQIIWAWLITIPIAALFSSITYFLFSFFIQ
ncbi:MAG: inorganic phosphate transporter [Candidatus Margulisbacteria bacterium]|nr:inorganic phosphate transporter [Candidatus Margulisiibacteriota bacterium]